MSTITEALAERATLIQESRGLVERSRQQGRDLNSEESATFDRIMNRCDSLMASARQEERERSVARRPLPADLGRDNGPLFANKRERARATELRALRGTREYRAAFLDWMIDGEPIKALTEHRDVQISNDAKGGFLAAPVQMSDIIVRLVNNLAWIRSKATVIPLVAGKSLAVPQVSTSMGDSNWTSETAAVVEDVTMAISQRVLQPNLLSKLSKVSMRFMSAAADPDLFIAGELGYAHGITEEKAFLTGSGVGQPLGIFIADPNGIPTSRDISTGNTATAIGADNVFQMKYNLKQTYRVDPSLTWIWSRDAIRMIMLLKDTANNYLFHASTLAGEPDRILNIPAAESEMAPNTFTTGSYLGVLGAFRFYHITEYDTISIQRLEELYANIATIGFICRRFVDGSPVVPEAFSRSKLA